MDPNLDLARLDMNLMLFALMGPEVKLNGEKNRQV